MKVRIFSHFNGTTWEGEVPEEALALEDEPVRNNDVNEALFRLFNRVDMDDVRRLEGWGYRLPSLSVDDTVTWAGCTWRVADVGFELVPASDA